MTRTLFFVVSMGGVLLQNELCMSVHHTFVGYLWMQTRIFHAARDMNSREDGGAIIQAGYSVFNANSHCKL